MAAHISADDAEVEQIEGIGALNFLEIDDLTVAEEGEIVDPDSISPLPMTLDLPLIPKVTDPRDDPFDRKVQASGEKWLILTGDDGHPRLQLDADSYLRSVFLEHSGDDPYSHCHRPIILKNPKTTLDFVIKKMKQSQPSDSDEAIKINIVLLWHDVPRVVTGADILGRLLDGITASSSLVDQQT